MRRFCLGFGVFLSCALVAVMAVPPSSFLVWNRTDSAPKGLYWRSDGPLTSGRWAIVSGNAPAAIWIAENGYLERGWPIIKRVRGVPGDEICRHGSHIFINKNLVAEALIEDSSGHLLPVWSGCFTLSEAQVFLLNDHPRSLDGRYFGATQIDHVTGAACLLIKVD